jgi:hypothetical protein
MHDNITRYRKQYQIDLVLFVGQLNNVISFQKKSIVTSVDLFIWNRKII